MNFSSAKNDLAVTSAINDGVYSLSMQLLHVVMFIFSLSGMLTNIINVMVFVKQGVTSDSITFSFFTMSLSDLLSSVLLLPWPLCTFMDSLKSTKSKNCYTITALATSNPHAIFTKLTCLIQTYISAERAFCVVFPLHVKSVIKTKNTVIINLILCCAIFIIYVPYYGEAKFVWERDAENSTVVLWYETRQGKALHSLIYIIGGLIMPNVAIVLNSLATVIIVTRLNLNRQWRQKLSSAQSASDTKFQVMSSKSLEVSKTVTVITTMYIVTFVCGQLTAMTAFALPEVTMEGTNEHLYYVVYALRFDTDAFHASVNMFFYLKMSSKYREVFNTIFYSLKK
ncbi:growth hormone secretagogue receptor type 1 [Biomphalaria pfeifferi]|uniref:Growth hormone secretagogue receptor type 1 n=1 Tax=Biomphalaria pfeifferi TaxID=112525 RepID=A0AAD8FJQ7_BIOPF|nr:growth hormone secretagogue receptor type 1 [Biomphalaria pfeifferi]